MFVGLSFLECSVAIHKQYKALIYANAQNQNVLL